MKLTQIEFAEKINYSDKAVSKWERAESIPDVVTLKSIADFFGVTVDYLISEDNSQNPIASGYEKSVHDKNHFLISSISIVALLVCELIVFICLQSTLPDNLRLHLLCCFVFPLPVCFILLVVFSSLWTRKRGWKILFISLLVWSVILVAFFIVMLATNTAYPLIFTVGIPAQIITLMSSGIIRVSRKKSSETQTENNDN